MSIDRDDTRKPLQQALTNSTLTALDCYASTALMGYPLFSSLAVAAKTISTLASSLRKGPGSNGADASDPLLHMLYLKLAESISLSVYRKQDTISRQTTNENAEALDILTSRKLQNRIIPREVLDIGKRIVSPMDLSRAYQLQENKPELSDFTVSCATIFPWPLAALLSLRAEKRFGAKFGMPTPQLVGNYQLATDLSERNSQPPSIIITANAAYWTIGREQKRFREYQILHELHGVSTIKVRKKGLIAKLRSKNVGFFDRSIAYQNLMTRYDIKGASPHAEFERSYSDLEAIDYSNMVLWQPVYWVFEAAGWRAVEGTRVDDPVSILVHRSIMKDNLDVLKWFLEAFFFELATCEQNLNWTIETLLKSEQFRISWESQCLANDDRAIFGELRRQIIKAISER